MPTAKLQTLTPVHIGNGLTLNKDIDFVVSNGQVGFLDEQKVLSLISRGNPLTVEDAQKWAEAIDNNEAILEWLRKKRGLPNVTLEQIVSCICPLRTGSRSTQLKTHYRTSMQGVCIPGSSLKGALKTAVWDSLTDAVTLGRFTAQDLKNGKGKWAYDTADKKLFGKTANEKSTRFLTVGDVHFPATTTEVHEFQILNKYGNRWETKRGQQMLIECIPAQATATFDFKLNRTLLGHNQREFADTWQRVNTQFISEREEQFAKRINAVTLELLDWELNELENENLEDHADGTDVLDDLDRVYKVAESCQAGEFVVRVGGHSGWKFTTSAWVRKEALNISDADLKSIRKTVQRNREYDMKLWPKTRKVSEQGQVFGFIKVSL